MMPDPQRISPRAQPISEEDLALILAALEREGKSLISVSLKYSEDQPRDESGQWTDGGGGSVPSTPSSTASKLPSQVSSSKAREIVLSHTSENKPLNPPHVQRGIELAIMHGVPEEHLQGLRFSSDIPSDCSSSATPGYWRSGNLNVVAGMYYLNQKTVSIAPDAQSLTGIRNTTIHEIGHHVTMSSSSPLGVEVNITYLQNEARNFAHKYAEETTHFNKSQMGLRNYSFSNGRELLADMYAAAFLANDKSWRNLKFYFGKNGGTYLKAYLGKLDEWRPK